MTSPDQSSTPGGLRYDNKNLCNVNYGPCYTSGGGLRWRFVYTRRLEIGTTERINQRSAAWGKTISHAIDKKKKKNRSEGGNNVNSDKNRHDNFLFLKPYWGECCEYPIRISTLGKPLDLWQVMILKHNIPTL